MPSLFEPCGLPQMTGVLYGTLPIVHNTGGLHDTVEHFNSYASTGNGFVFDNYDSNALSWGMDEAMNFWNLPKEKREQEITRIMREGNARFTHEVCAEAYIDMYEKMLQRPLLEY
jgi:glycogen synthase